jgi:hypothetical protein
MSKAVVAICTALSVSATALSAWAAPVADLVYVNAKVVTVDPQFSIQQAVAVSGDKIVGVGSTAKMKALAKPGARVIDLGGKTMLPGFNDNHIHLGEPLMDWKYSSMIGEVVPWLVGADTIPKVLAAVKGQAAKLPKGTWIVGELPREEWPNGTEPLLKDLDTVAPDHPVAIARGPHTLLVNSKALEIAKVTKDTHPPGGEILRDANGKPIGKVLESARRVIWDVMPAGSRGGAFTTEAKFDDWRKLLTQLESLGITSVNVAGVRPNDLKSVDEFYKRYGETMPRAVVQLRLSPGYDSHTDLDEGIKQSISELDAMGSDRSHVFTQPKLKMGAVKLSIDGGLSAPVFWSLKEYENRPGFHGQIRIPDRAYYAVARHAHELGWQVGIHTMGDGAAKMVTDQMEKILADQPRADHRHYLHHVAAQPPEETMAKMGKLGINVASQPGFLLSLGSYADEALDPVAENHQDPSRSLLNHGIRVSYGSDAGPYGPIAAIFAAVTRVGWNGKVHGIEEAVTVKEAIQMHTLEPAYFTFDEKIKGSIQVGKLADFVVLSDDILTIDPMKIQDVKVLRTVVGGKEVFVRP